MLHSHYRRVRIARWLIVTLLFLTLVPVCAAQSSDTRSESESVEQPKQTIAPPDVYARVMLVRAELDLVRREMGKPRQDRPDIAVFGAAPHEVYFQALTMFRKAERLCFEQTRERVTAPRRPNGPTGPADVYAVVDAALNRIQCVKQQLAIPESSQAEPQDDSKTPTDVFRAVVRANQTLNLLLQKQFSPSDVFQQVTLAIGYSARLLEQFPEAERIPPEPAWERRKRPADVMRRLIDCFGLIHDVAEASGLSVAELKPDDVSIEGVPPGDVYDIASLLVADLAYLQAKLKDGRPPRDVFNPGNKLPSHVFQRAGILEAQLAQLKKFAKSNPNWLKASAESRQP